MKKRILLKVLMLSDEKKTDHHKTNPQNQRYLYSC